MIQRITDWRARRAASRHDAAVSLQSARERASRGAHFLDEADPGWASRLDPESLQITDGSACVLGQLHGSYRLGLGRARVLDLSSAPLASLSPFQLGFHPYTRAGAAREALDGARLTRAWREAVGARCGAALQEPGGPVDGRPRSAGVA